MTKETMAAARLLIKNWNCRFCNRTIPGRGNLFKHESACHLNPHNLRTCVICSKPIKNFKENATCSTACANTHFRSGEDNPNWKKNAYRTTCFHFHKKECVVCGENRIVSVHHLDENSENNNPENLIPLCPTHHQYWHSRFRHLIEQTIRDYLLVWGKKAYQAS